jgi:hypothetical protein
MECFRETQTKEIRFLSKESDFFLQENLVSVYKEFGSLAKKLSCLNGEKNTRPLEVEPLS